MSRELHSGQPHLVSVLLCMSCPPEQVSRGFHRLFEQNHLPLLTMLQDIGLPTALSIPWGLTERWHSDGYHQVLQTCSELRRAGQTEFVASAAYYPILPLLPREAIARQVFHDQIRHAELYQGWSCRGFVPPEMAFGPELLPILAEAGYEWCAVDDSTYCCLTPEPPRSHVARCGELNVLLRSSLWSKALIGSARSGSSGSRLGREMMDGLTEWFGEQRGYVVLGLDTECLGTHRGGSLSCLRDFLGAIAQSDSFELCRPTDIVRAFPGQDDEVPPGSWRTTPEQFWEGEFFVPWQSRYVRAHSYLWELTELAVESVGKLQERLDRSLHAGFFWWDEKNSSGLPSGAARGLRTLLDVIAAAAPEDLDRALELAARLDEVAP